MILWGWWELELQLVLIELLGIREVMTLEAEFHALMC